MRGLAANSEVMWINLKLVKIAFLCEPCDKHIVCTASSAMLLISL